MTILHVCIGGDVAGGQVVALQLARAGRARGDTAIFVVPRRGPFSELLEGEEFPVYVIDLNRTFNVRAALRLVRLARGADILHTHTLIAGNVLSRMVGRLAGVPVVAHLHIENHFRPTTRPLLRALDNATARLCARLVAVSEDTRRAYERQGYPPGWIEVVHNGVEIAAADRNGRLRAELGLPDGVPLVGEVARLCEVKGQRDLIEAMTLLPDVRLVLAGSDLERNGAYRAGLEREADRLGVRDRIVFAGFRDDPERVLAELDVVALPSWTEGMPLVLLEAMAQRRPVVATPVGGTPEVVADGETGLLVPPRDPQALAAALGRLLGDADLRARMGDAGYRRVRERFSAEAMTRRLLKLYDEVAAA